MKERFAASSVSEGLIEQGSCELLEGAHVIIMSPVTGGLLVFLIVTV